MPYTSLIKYICFISLLIVHTACNSNQLSHMRSSNPKQEKIHSLAYDQDNCSICLDSLQNQHKKIIILTKCKHAFHQTCMLDAIQAKYDTLPLNYKYLPLEQTQSQLTCPKCRASILDTALLYHPRFVKHMLKSIILWPNIQAFKTILEHVEDINLITFDGNSSLLHTIVIFNNVQPQYMPSYINMIKALVQKNIDINAKDIYGQTPLHTAVRIYNGNISMISLLLKYSNVNDFDDGGWTPLHTAIKNGHINVINLLIAHGADIHTLDNMGDLKHKINH